MIVDKYLLSQTAAVAAESITCPALANVWPAVPASCTELLSVVTVVYGGIYCNLLTNSEPRNLGPDLSDCSRELMAQSDGYSYSRIRMRSALCGYKDWASQELMNIGAADSTEGYGNADIVGATWSNMSVFVLIL